MDNNNIPSDETSAAAAASLRGIRSEIQKVVVGQSDILDQVLMAMVAGGHVLIEGAPGLGKTLMVKALAKTFKGTFSRVQFTPDLMPTDICGHTMYDNKTGNFKLKKGPIFANLLLADEINRASAKTQSALLEVMQEQQVTIEGQTLPLAPPFMTLATQNPLEQEGTYPLPEAQLDRFLIKILIDYPEAQDEVELVLKVTGDRIGHQLDVEAVVPVATAQDIVDIQKTAAALSVDRRVVEYAVDIVRQTRTWSGVSVGAGPRGAIALIRISRAAALLSGRDFVTPDDVKRAALPTLRHRILLSPALEIEGYTTDNLVRDILDKIQAPRL